MSMYEDTYYVDLNEPLEVLHFPADFADHLRDCGREQDARAFLHKWKVYATYMDEEDLAEHGLQAVMEVARSFAPVEDVSRVTEYPFPSAEQVLEDLERQEYWDREQALVERDAPDLQDLSKPEFPDAHVFLDVGDAIIDLLPRAVAELHRREHHLGAESLRKEGIFFLSRRPTNREIFKLVWSYVTIYPAAGFLEEEEAILQAEVEDEFV